MIFRLFARRLFEDGFVPSAVHWAVYGIYLLTGIGLLLAAGVVSQGVV